MIGRIVEAALPTVAFLVVLGLLALALFYKRGGDA
jgi:hypothetical protein